MMYNRCSGRYDVSPLAEGRELKFVWVGDTSKGYVAPRGGAGIEIQYSAHEKAVNDASPLAEGRELKYLILREIALRGAVAPRGGAGIEMRMNRRSGQRHPSPLAERRELKWKR